MTDFAEMTATQLEVDLKAAKDFRARKGATRTEKSVMTRKIRAIERELEARGILKGDAMPAARKNTKKVEPATSAPNGADQLAKLEADSPEKTGGELMADLEKALAPQVPEVKQEDEAPKDEAKTEDAPKIQAAPPQVPQVVPSPDAAAEPAKPEPVKTPKVSKLPEKTFATIWKLFRSWTESEAFDPKDDAGVLGMWVSMDPEGMFEGTVELRTETGWSWMVKGTAKYAETPELIDTGTSATVEGAVRAADRAARKELKAHRARIRKEQDDRKNSGGQQQAA